VVVELIGWVWKRLGLVGWVWEGQGLITVDLLELVFFITVVENRELCRDMTNRNDVILRVEEEVRIQSRRLYNWKWFLPSSFYTLDKIILLFLIRACLLFVIAASNWQ
jgi:hypothetical protein